MEPIPFLKYAHKRGPEQLLKIKKKTNIVRQTTKSRKTLFRRVGGKPRRIHRTRNVTMTISSARAAEEYCHRSVGRFYFLLSNLIVAS